jgi:hypothetical protein
MRMLSHVDIHSVIIRLIIMHFSYCTQNRNNSATDESSASRVGGITRRTKRLLDGQTLRRHGLSPLSGIRC